MDQIPLQDVQGLILRGYGMDALRVFVLRVEHAAQARLLLADLPVTIATVWDNKPDFCLNVAITYEGLGALGLTQRLLESFPDEFKQGAVARARNVGDTGQSAPENWKGGLAGPGVHVLVLLFAQNSDIREEQSQWLRERWREAMSEVSSHDAYNLPGNLAHFGFRDGFSQPTISGAPPNPIPDAQPQAPAGEFLLGYESQFTQFTYPVPRPPSLGLNGSFLAFRILAQDCAAFENLLSGAPEKYGISGEMLAAKMVGRWRNGVPLTLSPETDSPNPPIQGLNKYDYANDARPSSSRANAAARPAHSITWSRCKVFNYCALTKSSMPADQSADLMPQADSIRLFLCGDVMTGRGIDQVLPHPADLTLHEPYIGDARSYVERAESVNGAIPRPVDFDYNWGDALAELDRAGVDLRIINLETSITSSEDCWREKEIHYRMHPRNIDCITAARIDCCCLANNHILDWGYDGLAETVCTLDAAGIAHTGAGRDAVEAAAPAVLEVPGKGRVLVFSYA